MRPLQHFLGRLIDIKAHSKTKTHVLVPLKYLHNFALYFLKTFIAIAKQHNRHHSYLRYFYFYVYLKYVFPLFRRYICKLAKLSAFIAQAPSTLIRIFLNPQHFLSGLKNFAVHTLSESLRIYHFPVWRADLEISGFA